MPLFRSFVELIKAYLDAHKQAANTIHLTRHDEHEILDALPELPEAVRAKVLIEGVRATFPRILGLRTVWDADQTKVEHETASSVGFR